MTSLPLYIILINKIGLTFPSKEQCFNDRLAVIEHQHQFRMFKEHCLRGLAGIMPYVTRCHLGVHCVGGKVKQC